MFKVDAEWTDDAQGKKDFDGDILSISTRYWPAGGGFSIFVPGQGFTHNPLDTKPSAKSSLVFRYAEYESIDLAEKEFEGETFEDVARQVEAWAQEQMNKVVTLLQKEFQALEQPNKASTRTGGDSHASDESSPL